MFTSLKNLLDRADELGWSEEILSIALNQWPNRFERWTFTISK